jgi:predicted acylesterase/phospholipase RssA
MSSLAPALPGRLSLGGAAQRWWEGASGENLQFALLIAGVRRPSWTRLVHALRKWWASGRIRLWILIASCARWARKNRVAAAALVVCVAGVDVLALTRVLASPRARRRRSLVATLASSTTYDAYGVAERDLAAFDAFDAPKTQVVKKSSPTPAAHQDEPVFRELDYGMQIFCDLRAGKQLTELEWGDLNSALRAGLAGAVTFVSDAVLSGDLTDDSDAARSLQRLSDACRALCFQSPDCPGWTARERALLLRETQQVCGTYALALSGGGMLGVFHTGVVCTLFKHGLLPRVLSGSSAGAIVAAVLCTRTDADLVEFFESWPDAGSPLTQLFLTFFGPTPTLERLTNLLFRSGFMLPVARLRANLRALYGDVTFAEAHKYSGRILNVSISGTRPGEQPRLLNHLVAGEVLVWSAVAASCSFPGLYAPQSLIAKRGDRFVPWLSPGAPVPDLLTAAAASGFLERRFRDGSVDADIPRHLLAELFNVSRVIVSQVNPYLFPVLRLRSLGIFTPTATRLIEGELRHWYSISESILATVTRITGEWSAITLIRDILHTVQGAFEGDVTILREPTTSDVLLAISNPKPHDLAIAFLKGQQATWAQLSRLKKVLSAVLCIEQATRELEQQVQLSRRRRQLGGDERASACFNPVRRSVDIRSQSRE